MLDRLLFLCMYKSRRLVQVDKRSVATQASLTTYLMCLQPHVAYCRTLSVTVGRRACQGCSDETDTKGLHRR